MSCPQCNKTFKRRRYLKEHIVLCEELHKSKYVQEANQEEIDDIPSLKDMYLILRKMMVKYNALEEKCEELQKFVKKTQKRVKILDWLNDTIQLDIGFEAWLNDIHVDQKMLEYTFDKSYHNGVIQILLQNLPQESEHTHPIKAFQQKKNAFYIYDDKMWKIMSQPLFERMLARITQLLFQQFNIWKDNHAERLKHDDRFYHGVYVHNQRCLLGTTGRGDREEIDKKLIRSNLYQYLKQNLSCLICYDFIF